MSLARRIVEIVAASAIAGVLAGGVQPGRLVPLAARAAGAGLTPLGTDSVAGLIGARDVVLADARPRRDYDLGHLPGAISLPWPAPPLPATMTPNKRIIVYCSSAYCRIGLELGSWLHARGFHNVALYIDGFDSWEAEGRHVEP